MLGASSVEVGLTSASGLGRVTQPGSTLVKLASEQIESGLPLIADTERTSFDAGSGQDPTLTVLFNDLVNGGEQGGRDLATRSAAKHALL